MRKHDLTGSDLQSVIEFDNDKVHFARVPSASVKALAQMQWALLLSLEAGIRTGSFEVGSEEIREKVKEEGIYDESNFAKTLNENKEIFRMGAPKKGEGAKRLSDAGEKQLAELVKSLAK